MEDNREYDRRVNLLIEDLDLEEAADVDNGEDVSGDRIRTSGRRGGIRYGNH